MDTLKIVKIGGNVIDDKKSLDEFLLLFSELKGPKILVHGGGKVATELSKKLGVPVKMEDGRRITDEATLEIITMVYAGKINKSIVVKLQMNNCNAMGLTGADGNSIKAIKRPVNTINYGYVGDVTEINTETIELLLKNNITPVFCAITHNKNGQLFNTNADTIATEIAIGFSETYNTELYYCFEKKGVLSNISDEDSVIEKITTQSYTSLIEEGIISDGMLPKLNNCINAVNNNVSKVYIGKHYNLLTDKKIFTTIEK